MQNSIVTITFNQFYFSVKKQIKLSQLVRVTGLMDVFVETSFFLTFFCTALLNFEDGIDRMVMRLSCSFAVGHA